MIYITSGHELGIGIEVFLKSFLCLTPQEQKSIVLVVDKFTLEENLRKCHISFDRLKNLNLQYLQSIKTTQSQDSLEFCLKKITSRDVLITLPTSKDQLSIDGHNLAGYTEYLRKKFQKDHLGMFFKSPKECVLLLSDHIPLKEVPLITTESFQEKISQSLISLQKIGFSPKKIIFAGINPHAGEGGVLGLEDTKITNAIENLKLPNAIGPISGDTLHYHTSVDNLLVYAFHDQALSSFKARFRTMGINLTLGLDFFRLTVDHGTAFELYGKNVSDYSGMTYTLYEALRIHKHVNK